MESTLKFLLFDLQIGGRRIHTVRTRGGNKKYRALRLDSGNFSWGSEGKCHFFLFTCIKSCLIVEDLNIPLGN